MAALCTPSSHTSAVPFQEFSRASSLSDRFLKMFTFYPVSGLLSSTPTSQGTFLYQWPGAQPVISSNGDSNAIVWTYDSAGGTLQASDATDLTKVLYVSPAITNLAKFQVITVINGHVYVAARAQIYSFTTH